MKQKSVSKVFTNRNIYIETALDYVPHVLTLVDRNPYSPTYGCFDREYWHYRTSDFPCGMSQENVLPLALLYTKNYPNNKWYNLERTRELAIAGIKFTVSGSHKDGTCDDYFPWERAMGALAFTTFAATEAYMILKMDEPEIVEFFRRRCDYMLSHNETGRLSNHQALAALSLYNTFSICGDEKYRMAAEDRIALALSWQNEEGWFQEYEGADPGYQTCTIDFLAKYYKKSGNESLIKPLFRAVEFCCYFMHPDGSYGGEYGSRNTYHYYPHGFELLAPHSKMAAALNDKYISGIIKGKRYYNDDDRMIAHLLHNWLMAWEDFCRRDDMNTPEIPPAGIKWMPHASLVSVRKNNYHAIACMGKGGVLKVFTNDKCIVSDTGLIGRCRDKKVLVSHLLDSQNQISVNPDEGIFKVKGFFSIRKSKLSTPFKLILFRLLNMSLGRFFPNLLRMLLQKLLITGKTHTQFKFERIIRFDEKAVEIEDKIDPKAEFDSLSVGSDATSIYVAASNVYQESVLGCKWTHAPQDVIKQKKPWIRRFEIEGEDN